jgi:hypothetical protein
MKNFLQRYWVLTIAALVIGYFYFSPKTPSNTPEVNIVESVDLKQVLTVTVDSIAAFENTYSEALVDIASDDALLNSAIWTLTEQLETDYNASQPKISNDALSVQPMVDGSFIAYFDNNNDGDWGDGESALFQIEIDSERSRVIASSDQGAVDEYRFSGGGFFSGYMIASLMNMQGASGVTSSQLAAKKPISASAAARARAGSGSFSRGK